MIGGLTLEVTYTNERSCFGYISPKYSSNNDKPLCIRVVFKEKQILLWAVFDHNIAKGYFALNPVYSKMMGLEEGMEVFVAPYTDVKILDEIFVDTDSPDDQEILEQSVQILQLEILDQLRLVVANQKAVVWISKSMPVVFTPKETGLLVNHSRIIVKVDAFDSDHGATNACAGTAKESDSEFNNIGIVNRGLLQPYLQTPQKLILRALLIDSDGKKNLIHPYTVFIHEDLLNPKLKDLTIILAEMDVVCQELPDEEDEDLDANLFACVCVEIVPIDNVIFRSLSKEVYNKNIPTVLIPKTLNQIINLENGIKVMLDVIGEKVDQPEHIEIVTYSDGDETEEEVIEKFKNCVIESTHSGKKFLINGQLVKQNEHISDGFLRFMLTPGNLKYTLLNSESFRNCTISARCLSEGSLILPRFSSPILEYDYKNYCRTIKSSEDLVQKIISHITFEVQREANFKSLSEIKSNILVTGENGAGKSALCQIVQKELTLWSRIVNCRALKGRKDVMDVISKCIVKCQEHSPSVLICDDVDALVPTNTEGLPPQEIAYYQSVAIIIKKMLQTCTGVCVLMTAVSMQSLHPTFKDLNGKPLFTAYFHIPELKQDERMEIFKHLVNDKIREMFLVEEDDIIKFAMDTVGSNVRDLHDYFNKKLYNAVRKKDAQAAERARLECDVRRGGERSQAFDIWGPVGGLHDVKRQLTEAIFWPIMYPALFPSQSCGILLYGPPGTGKSHIGSCLARLTNMQLITVKGPELLSKYIGQSEKAVRDIFDQAAMQHPCILFFDEFDSLAPKRGHDSTGVTDRVVNQLLARLDGAEGGARGAVLAATARPDLVDPALLRAGRLAAHLYVGMPGESDRLEVIQTLSKDVSIDDEVDLQDLAQKTEGYSPADLKSLLVTAQLGKLERQLVQVNIEKQNLEEVKIGKEDIENALEETKPSLSSEKLLFYDTIYKRFRGENLSPEQAAMSQMMQKQKVTLA